MRLQSIGILVLILLIQQIFCLVSDNQTKANNTFTIVPYFKTTHCAEILFSEEVHNLQTHLMEHPWVVGIVFYFPKLETHRIVCAGVLISMYHVLTGGICVTENEFATPKYVRVGEWNTSSVIDCENSICHKGRAQNFPIKKIFTRYDPDWEWNDNIALIKLSHPQENSNYVGHICLPNDEMHQKIHSYAGSSFVVSGWSFWDDGSSSDMKLKKAVLVDADDVCENFFFYRNKYERSTHFCSSSSKACAGDGPVMGIDITDPDNPYWYIFGFYTYTHDCSSAPKVFTKVVPYMKWIKDHMLL